LEAANVAGRSEVFGSVLTAGGFSAPEFVELDVAETTSAEEE
jgi:hypothetical protein